MNLANLCGKPTILCAQHQWRSERTAQRQPRGDFPFQGRPITGGHKYHSRCALCNIPHTAGFEPKQIEVARERLPHHQPERLRLRRVH